MMRLAIIGMGEMGTKYAQMILDNKSLEIELKAFTRIKKHHYEKIKDLLGDEIKIYDTDQMLFEAYDKHEFDIDAVLIVTPHYHHEFSVKEAFKRNLHVLCDKPAGVYLKQGREMLETKPENQVYGFVFQQRVFPIYQELKRIIDSKIYGQMKRVSYIVSDWYRTDAYYKSAPWRATYKTDGGGVLINQCPHSLDMLCYLFGRPDQVHGFCSEGKYHDIEVEDEVTAYLSWDSGLSGIFVTSTGETPGVNRLEISFDKAVITCTKDRIEIVENEHVESYYRQQSLQDYQEPKSHKKVISFEMKHQNAYIDILNNFKNSVINQEHVIASGKEALDSLYLSNAIYLSCYHQKTIRLYDIGSAPSLSFEEEFIAWLNQKSR